MLLKGIRTLFFILRVAAAAVIIAAALAISSAAVEPQAHIAPDYPRTDIGAILEKDRLSESDYRTLFFQTGLGKSAVDELRDTSADPVREITGYQECFFRDIDYKCERNSPISREEYLVDGDGNITAGTKIVPLQDGDILITKSSHVYGWRNGHAAIVVDAAKGLTLESAVLGTDSTLQNIEKWEAFPNFMVLRLKGASSETADAAAQAAFRYLYGIPYDFTVGVLSPKMFSEGEVTGTQCAHLVWEAYEWFGVDLDSDGGMVVTPKDIANSPLLEIVQVYGVDPAGIWP